MEREPTPASDSAVNVAADRPPLQSGSGVPIAYGYAPDYGAPFGMMQPRNGMASGIYGAAGAAPDPVKVLDPVSLLLALRKRWFVALSLGLLTGVMAGAAVWNLWPPTLGGAQIQLMVKSTSPFVFIQEASGDFNVFKRTQSMVVKSRRILHATIEKPEVAELAWIKKYGDPVRALEQSVLADYGMGPETLTVTLPATPEEIHDARLIVEAIAATYLDDRKLNSNNSQRLKVLREMYKPYAESIKNNRELLLALTKPIDRKEHHVAQQEHRMLLRRLEIAEKNFVELESKREAEEFDLANAREQLNAINNHEITQEEIDALVEADAVYSGLKAKIAKERIDLQSMKFKDGESNPLRKKLLDKVAKDEASLAMLQKQLRVQAGAQIKETRSGKLSRQVAELEHSVALRLGFEKRIREGLKALHHASLFASQTNAEAETLKVQIEADLQMASRLSSQIGDLELELKAPDRVTKFSDAYIYEPTMSRKQMMSTWAAGIGAFGLVLLGISWWEFRGRRISSVDEVVNNLGLRVVGALPALPDRRGGYAASRDSVYPNYLIESVDTTRTMLLHAARREALRSVMVTSANAGEGKTSLSIQLAASLARAGRKTLLIDGDMRNPAAHQVFNLAREPGFSELIRGEVEIAATVVPTTVRNLWLIPAGRWNPHATEVLSQEAVVPILERLKTEFDFIVVDSSPVLAAVDSLLIGQQVDAIIFSILHEVSHSPSVFAAHQRLESLGVRILGAVVNGVASSQLGHKIDYAYEDESPPDMEPEEAEQNR